MSTDVEALADREYLCDGCKDHFVQEHLCDECAGAEVMTSNANGVLQGRAEMAAELYRRLLPFVPEAARWISEHYDLTFATCEKCGGLSDGNAVCIACDFGVLTQVPSVQKYQCVEDGTLTPVPTYGCTCGLMDCPQCD